MQTNSNFRIERGFTLVEVAMVSLLLALLGGIVYGTMSGISRTRATLEAERSALRTAQYIIGRLTRELQNRREEPVTSLTQRRGGEGQGGEESEDDDDFDAYLLGFDKQLGGFDADTIQFVSMGTGQSMGAGASNAGLVEIGYALEERRGVDGEQKILVRFEQPAGEVTKQFREERRLIFPVSEDVEGLNFRYRMRERWFNAWSKEQVGLPDAVEVTVTIRGNRGELRTYRTAISLVFDWEQRNTGDFVTD